MNGIQDVKLTGMAAFLPSVATATADQYQTIYDANRDRIYSLAFWMTDNELAAEETLSRVFLRAFSMTEAPSAEMIDRSLLTELRDSIAIGSLTLHVADATTELGVRHNVKRVHLERAIVALPATERLIFCMHDGEGYSHNRIARTLGITEQQSTLGLHQARLRVRELVAEMR
jgi:RNA polymerase sigma-70 factor (ECF subfamily)